MRKKLREARHVRLYHYLLNCPAWKDLDATARAIYLDIESRFMGINNGKIVYSTRQAAEELKISTNTAGRALANLQAHGFIVVTSKGAYHYKLRHATEWRLTDHPCDVSKAPPTKDFMRWSPSMSFPVVAGPRPLHRRSPSQWKRSRGKSAVPTLVVSNSKPYPLAN